MNVRKEKRAKVLALFFALEILLLPLLTVDLLIHVLALALALTLSSINLLSFGFSVVKAFPKMRV